KAYFSTDGIHWPTVIPFLSALGQSSFDQKADLSEAAAGSYSYFVKIELGAGVQIHRLRINSEVQTSKALFPMLMAGSVNQLSYRDLSPPAHSRNLTVTVRIPNGKYQLKGLHAESLVPESSVSSIASDYAAANLVDGDPDSLAYPGSTHLDYLIRLNGTYELSLLSVDWRSYGTDPRYVKSWQVLTRNGAGDWVVAAKGEAPGTPTLDVPLNTTATDMRIVADGGNWIGIYDAR